MSHLQRLREEEERQTQEETEQEALTYDRPELINKVIFRRSKTTGTWEVCPYSREEVSHAHRHTPKRNKTRNQSINNNHI